MIKKNQNEKSKAKNEEEKESSRIDQELFEIIEKNKSFKKGITKLVEEIDKNKNKNLNQ